MDAFDRGNRRPTYMTVNPCRSLERFSYDVEHVQLPQIVLNGKLGISFDFTEFTYKEIKTVRGMDIQALIGIERQRSQNIIQSMNIQINVFCDAYFLFSGNAGGYLGLFLGYALLNVPGLVQEACRWLFTSWNEIKSQLEK